MEEMVFERFFTLEEAAGMIPLLVLDFETAHRELSEIRDQIILYKRFQHQREKVGETLSETEEQVLKQKWEAYEAAFNRWVRHFIEQGILIRDLDRGLIDFPYQSKSGEPFFLCWQLGEDGLFYFHDTQEGFGGRKPISLLPE